MVFPETYPSPDSDASHQAHGSHSKNDALAQELSATVKADSFVTRIQASPLSLGSVIFIVALFAISIGAKTYDVLPLFV